MERQIGLRTRYLTHVHLGGAIPHGWAIEVSEGFFTPILGDQVALRTVRSAYDACLLISEYLAMAHSSVRPQLPDPTLPEQLKLF